MQITKRPGLNIKAISKVAPLRSHNPLRLLAKYDRGLASWGPTTVELAVWY